MSRLNAQLRAGEVTLESSGPSGYLVAAQDTSRADRVAGAGFLEDQFPGAADQPEEPARDLLQRHHIGRLGTWRTGPELIAQDRSRCNLLHARAGTRSVPQFERNDTCISCHTSDATQNVPGPFVGSVFPGVDGITMYGPAYTTDHRSPFELRWGGWYVTGTHQASRHGQRRRY